MSRKRKSKAWGEDGFEDWGGYMAAKQAKLEEQFHNEADNEIKTSNIFEGIAIFVNGYTNPTADELRHLMMQHGGTYHHYMRPKATTHIIASNLPYSKIMLYRKSQNPIPICKSEWIMDSIKAGRILNFQKYLLYSHCTDVQLQLKCAIQNTGNKTNDTFQTHNVQRNNEVNSLKIGNSRTETIKHTSIQENTFNPVLPMSSRDTHSTKNSEFISEFYNNSRLHHIATMGATFKEYVNELRDKNNGEFPGLIRLKNIRLNRSLFGSQLEFNIVPNDLQEENKMIDSQDCIIMHIDMDCFFVSVGLRDRPELRGLPIAVTHAKGNKDGEHGSLSEIASCSYEARKAGVKNGMFLGEALKICPNLKPVPYNFEGYTEVSYMLYDIVASYTLDIEAVSCDEMYADCTKILEESSLTPMEFATIIRQEIKEKTGCPVSTGFGSNKLLARLATRKAKPDGQFYIQQEHINDCVSTFNVQDLPGVGWTTTHKLNNLNVRTCAELQAISLATLQKEFGKKTGDILYNMCRGVDHSKLNLEHVRKSVSAEVNYGIRFENNDDAIDFLKKLCREVCNRLNKINAKGRCITLKLLIRAKEAPKETEKFMGHGLCDYVTRSKNLISPISDVDIITKEVIILWNQMQKVPEDARGIGIQISKLEILKNKSRGTTLLNFIKNKPSSTVQQTNKRQIETNKGNEVQPLTHSDVVAVDSNDVNNEQKLHVPSGINESVFSELPKSKGLSDDNKDGGTVSVQNTNKTQPQKSVQMHQENFFKETKPGISRPKVEMPPIQEIDMSVLIELPEDIRNEILNEYSANKNQNQTNANTNKNSKSSTSKAATSTEIKCDEQNISYSQVDPEFLAALSEDLRRDVRMYCTVKNAEYNSKKRKDGMNSNGSVKNNENTKQIKKGEPNSKNKNSNKNGKVTHSKNKKKNGQTLNKALKNVNELEQISKSKTNTGIAKFIMPPVEKTSVNDRITTDDTEAILSHNRTISEDNDSANQHQDILIDLVNRLLNLPLKQMYDKNWKLHLAWDI
ncbi:DNA repair protein REV1 isoform X2 [Bombus vosnesenskii]|uniref:DNA repair protein REV1 n=1 Tax=Bombus vosnesenskii TaxID=207650 RepID=A0A6J3KZ87_9HYME|nr:DNA repair protein REV1 isoform X2 [Bombus vosnesenskii]